MHPNPYKGLPVGTFALSDLAFVVGEDVVLATRMNIDLLTKELGAHRRTLDVPAGKTGIWILTLPFHSLSIREAPPQHMPGILPHALLPERKVCRVLFRL